MSDYCQPANLPSQLRFWAGRITRADLPPRLLVQAAAEIERLRERLEEAKEDPRCRET